MNPTDAEKRATEFAEEYAPADMTAPEGARLSQRHIWLYKGFLFGHRSRDEEVGELWKMIDMAEKAIPHIAPGCRCEPEVNHKCGGCYLDGEWLRDLASLREKMNKEVL